MGQLGRPPIVTCFEDVIVWSEQDDDCERFFLGGSNGKGYYRVTIDGHRDFVHRHAWFYYHGEWPWDFWVLHHCDVRNCINPYHLFKGDAFANMQDAAIKMRINTSKLSPEQVLEIRHFSKQGRTNWDLANLYGVAPSNINRIVKRLTWDHI